MLEQNIEVLLKCYQDILLIYDELKDFLNTYEQGYDDSSTKEVELQFFDQRNKYFSDLQAQQSKCQEIQAGLCDELGITQFSLRDLRSKIPDNLFSDIEDSIEKQICVLLTIKDIDNRLIDRSQMKLQATKLELQRLQSAKRIKNTYQINSNNKAIFVDKTK